MELVGSTNLSLQWLILLIFGSVFFLNLYCKARYTLFANNGEKGKTDEIRANRE